MLRDGLAKRVILPVYSRQIPGLTGGLTKLVTYLPKAVMDWTSFSFDRFVPSNTP